jgi:hypothetical protein
MHILRSTLLLVPILALSAACEKRTAPEKAVDKVENKVKDATDSRPGEGLRDAAEDAKDAIKK